MTLVNITSYSYVYTMTKSIMGRGVGNRGTYVAVATCSLYL